MQLRMSPTFPFSFFFPPRSLNDMTFHKSALTLSLVLPQKRPAEEMALYPLVHVCFQPNGRLQCRQFQVSLPEKEQVGLLHIKAKPKLDLHICNIKVTNKRKACWFRLHVQFPLWILVNYFPFCVFQNNCKFRVLPSIFFKNLYEFCKEK